MDFEQQAREGATNLAHAREEAKRERIANRGEAGRMAVRKQRQDACRETYLSTRERFKELFSRLKVEGEFTAPIVQNSFDSSNYRYVRQISARPIRVQRVLQGDKHIGDVLAVVEAKLLPKQGLHGAYEGWRRCEDFTIVARTFSLDGKLTHDNGRERFGKEDLGIPASSFAWTEPQLQATEERLSALAPSVNLGLDQIFAAAADPELNPEVAPLFAGRPTSAAS